MFEHLQYSYCHCVWTSCVKLCNAPEHERIFKLNLVFICKNVMRMSEHNLNLKTAADDKIFNSYASRKTGTNERIYYIVCTLIAWNYQAVVVDCEDLIDVNIAVRISQGSIMSKMLAFDWSIVTWDAKNSVCLNGRLLKFSLENVDFNVILSIECARNIERRVQNLII